MVEYRYHPLMATDYEGLSEEVVAAFESAYPCSEDADVLAEIRALEALHGCPMPEEVARFLQTERSELFDPSPVELAAMEHPFEALILRAQEMDDTAAVLFPLTGSIFLRNYGGVEVLGHVSGIPGQPVMPFVGWRNEKWAYDLPSFVRLTLALRVYLGGDDEDEVEGLLEPVWGRVQRTQWTENMFYDLDETDEEERLDAAWAEREDLRPRLSQWWRHERCLLMAFGLIGKFRPPEEDAFAQVPFGALDLEHLRLDLGTQMNLLWRGWFLDEGDLLERTMAATEGSSSLLVQDARRLISELKNGRTKIGSVDMHEGRANYKTWIDDPESYRRSKRSKRRTMLEGCLEPSPHGMELVRAQWPLHESPTTDLHAGTREHTWDGNSRTLTLTTADGTTEHELAQPGEEQKLYLALTAPATAVSPSGRRFTCAATLHRRRRDGNGWENAPVLAECDLDTRAWRVLADTKSLAWVEYVEEDRWVVHQDDHLFLLRDLGDEMNSTKPAFVGQPKMFHVPEIGALVSYGKTDLVEGRDPGDLKSPWIRVYGYWRDRLACIAGYPVDGVEMTAKQSSGAWAVGFVSADREVAWELKGLQAALESWREASKGEAAEERAKRDAFGDVTVGRAVEAVNTFLGTEYGPDIQEGLDAAYAHALAELQADSAAVEAARAAKSSLEFVDTFRGPFYTSMTTLRRDKEFLTFAFSATGMRPEYADIVVRAAVAEAWKALRT